MRRLADTNFSNFGAKIIQILKNRYGQRNQLVDLSSCTQHLDVIHYIHAEFHYFLMRSLADTNF